MFWQICEESEMTSFASQIISAGVFKQQTYQAHCLAERSFFKMRWNTEIQGHNPQMGQPFILKWHIAKCWLILIIERSLKYTIQRKTEQHQSTNNVAVFNEKRKKNYKKTWCTLWKKPQNSCSTFLTRPDCLPITCRQTIASRRQNFIGKKTSHFKINPF